MNDAQSATKIVVKHAKGSVREWMGKLLVLAHAGDRDLSYDEAKEAVATLAENYIVETSA